MYALGIDLGTTYTAAASWRDGRVEIASLGSRGTAIPSVVLLRQDETFLTGESANRRALTEPQRVAREFKRRLGDTTPILLGGVPYSAEALMARLLRWTVDEVATREGAEPSAICVCHPANWGPYKMDLLRQAVRMTNLEQPVTFTTEPEAAAVFYAQGRHIDPGALVAVYDLGGGTFDAAVLRKTETGFAILGQPEGIERLGGIDFDAAVFSHVSRAIGDRLSELDEDDPAAVAAVGRLREECVEAKEALSSDTDVSIPVMLPNLTTDVRLTRTELEAMVRPALYESIEALRRALRSAGVLPEQLHSVLLVGGSSRIPIVAQMVGAELGRPVAVDAHPKHAVALGAAWVASGAAGGGREVEGAQPATPAALPPVMITPPVTEPPVTEPPVTEPPAAASSLPPADTSPLGAPDPSAARTVAYDEPEPSGTFAVPLAAAAGTPPPSRPTPSQPPRLAPDGPPRNRRAPMLAAAGGVLAAAAIATAVVLNMGDDPTTTNDNLAGADTATSPVATPAPVVTTPAAPVVPADEQCTDTIRANERWVCLTSATIAGGEIVIEYDAEFAGSTPNINGGFHLHIYGADATGTDPPDEVMGSHASNPGDWYIEDQNPSVRSVDSDVFQQNIGDAPKVCARIANGQHELVPDVDGTFKTGNCVPITVG
jgi:actin-like ATPase involved in cell morphogenesis